ncbi:MAG: enoyl-CoA hydratase/isomerase family protein [Marinobacter sp.]|nr:enoyl-CoA hydratase/isomerase family protein [Marinobacter sp.]
MQTSTELELVIDGAVATLTFCGEEPHCWTEASLLAFNQHLLALGRDHTQVRALVITGEGSSWFCGGLSFDSPRSDHPVAGTHLSRLFAQAFGALRRFNGVTVAAVNGAARNEGIDCMLSCDFRIITPASHFVFNRGSQGLIPFGGATQLLPRILGESWAKRMLLLEEVIEAPAALDIGLADFCAEPDQLLATAYRIVDQALKQSPMASRAGRMLIEHARMRPLETGFAAERDWLVHILDAAAPTSE